MIGWILYEWSNYFECYLDVVHYVGELYKMEVSQTSLEQSLFALAMIANINPIWYSQTRAL